MRARMRLCAHKALDVVSNSYSFATMDMQAAGGRKGSAPQAAVPAYAQLMCTTSAATLGPG
eukprot:1159968-Pelagomonas_calceolata.AAC.20